MNPHHSDNKHRGFRASISDESFIPREVTFDDPKVTSAQVAEAAGARPLEEFVILHHLKSGELESLRPTETTDLREDGVEQFFVIRGSETFRFVIEGLSLEWPRRHLAAKHLKTLARAESGVSVVIVLPTGEREIPDDQEVDFAALGLERFRLRRYVTVIYNQDQRFRLEARIYTTEELIQIFRVPEGYRLDLFTGKGMRELKPGEQIPVRDNMEFTSHVPVGTSS